MMATQTLLLLLLNFACASGLTYLLYYKLKNDKTQRVLALLRFLSFFLIGILLINPELESTETRLETPQLIFAVDNSESIQKLGQPELINAFISDIKTDDELNALYDINFIAFDARLNPLKGPLAFNSNSTNLSQVIDYVNQDKNLNRRIVIMSDGNQTLGEDYEFKSFNENVLSSVLVIGDTATYKDSKIDLVNINDYAYYKNKFPIEVFISQNTRSKTQHQLTIYQNEQKIASQNVSLSADGSKKIDFIVEAKPVGLNMLKVILEPLNGEKNIRNNEKLVSVEVIDSRSKIALISDIIHPDIGFFKRVLETNKELEFQLLSTDESFTILDYDLFILYQPQSSFDQIITHIQQSNSNVLWIGGTQTDYNFLNSLNLGFEKEVIPSTEAYTAIKNPEFNLFQVDDISFSDLPPLDDQFGDLKLKSKVSILLDKEVNGIQIETPLWMFNNQPNRKVSFFFGENIWKWRSHFYRVHSSFQTFDATFQKILQYLSQSKSKNSLSVDVEPLINLGENSKINATYYDSNFEANTQNNFIIELEPLNSGEAIQSRMVVNQTEYSFDLSNLEPGTYAYTISSPDVTISKQGQFKILDFSLELEFENANYAGLQHLAKSENIFLFKNKTDLVSDLKTNPPQYIQTSVKKTQTLINFEWLILLLALTLGFEWFYRKYKGLI